MSDKKSKLAAAVYARAKNARVFAFSGLVIIIGFVIFLLIQFSSVITLEPPQHDDLIELTQTIKKFNLGIDSINSFHETLLPQSILESENDLQIQEDFVTYLDTILYLSERQRLEELMVDTIFFSRFLTQNFSSISNNTKDYSVTLDKINSRLSKWDSVVTLNTPESLDSLYVKSTELQSSLNALSNSYVKNATESSTIVALVVRIGIIFISLYLMQIILMFIKYQFQLSNHLFSVHDALHYEDGDGDLSKIVDVLMPPRIVLGKSPSTPVDKMMESIKDIIAASHKKG